ncbi:Uncharacterised protein [Klebsiella pneumoniae]|nr:Uncharacterised protein [Klebsiella pneumoniae]
MAALEAGVDRGQVVGFVVDAVIRVVGIAQDHLVYSAVVGVAQHQAALPRFETRVAVHRLRIKAVVGVHLDVDRPGLDVVGFGGQRVVAVVAGVGAAGTGDARRVGLVGHHFRAAGFHLRHRRHVELHAADIKVLHPGALAVVVHPEVVVDPLLRTLVEVAAGPEIGVGVGFQHVGDPDVGLLQVNFVAPVVEHHVKIPDSPLRAFEGLADLEFAAVAFVAQTADRRGAVIGAVDADIFLVAGLEVSAIAGIAAELEAERNGHIRRGGGGLRVGDHVDLFVGRGVDFRLAVGQSFINGFGDDGVDLFLSKFLRHYRGKRKKRGDNRHG